MRIGFDLDGIFINGPPFIPKDLIEWLYRGPQDGKPKYRFPSTKLEQQIRKWSHKSLFRPKISKNIEWLKGLSSSNHELFLISSRYKFLNKETNNILHNYKIKNLFSVIYLNSKDLQPHTFKAKILAELKLDVFIEDDLVLLRYLRLYFPETKLLWYNPGRDTRLPEGITHIKTLNEIFIYSK